MTPRLHCSLSSHWPSFSFLPFMAFFIPSIQFFYGLPRALFCFGSTHSLKISVGILRNISSPLCIDSALHSLSRDASLDQYFNRYLLVMYCLGRPQPRKLGLESHIHIVVVTSPLSIFNFSHSSQKKKGRHENKHAKRTLNWSFPRKSLSEITAQIFTLVQQGTLSEIYYRFDITRDLKSSTEHIEFIISCENVWFCSGNCSPVLLSFFWLRYFSQHTFDSSGEESAKMAGNGEGLPPWLTEC
jgi:hypothetical protein